MTTVTVQQTTTSTKIDDCDGDGATDDDGDSDGVTDGDGNDNDDGNNCDGARRR
jgi:hypothetical protein